MAQGFELERGSRWLVASAAFACAVFVLGGACPLVAHACGGFFCSRAAPVVQAAEEIIFVDNPDDTVTAVIRINYQGPSQKFAWVLPIDGAPSTIAVSSNQAFNRLRTSTDPSYTMTTTVEGSCKADPPPPQYAASAPGASQGASNAGAAGAPATPPVTVVDSGSVGPYDFEVISVNPQLSDAADVAVTWLTDHGYDVTDLGPSVLRPYLEEGLNLMAFKLTKGANASTGSIRPVMLTYHSKLPAIPIRPTAVATQPDMGILVYVLAEHQAVPKNYRSLVLNEALINWFNFQSNYRAVVTAAADDAGGQGFVSEMAGDTAQLKQVVFSSSQAQQWMQFSNRVFGDGLEVLQQAFALYNNWDGFQDAACANANLPADIPCASFASSPTTYRTRVQLDPNVALKALYEQVVRPVIATQELVDSRPYFTRMFTTMSADEMTADPAFDFNPDLADISNRHVATRIVECDSSVTLAQAPWRVQLPQGGVVVGRGSAWPFGVGGAIPPNLKIVELGTSGGGKVVEDNGAMTLKTLAALAAASGSSAANAGSGGSASPKPAGQRVPIGGSVGGRGGVAIGGGTGGAAGSDESAGAGGASEPVQHKHRGCSVASGPGAAGGATGAIALSGLLFAFCVWRRRTLSRETPTSAGARARRSRFASHASRDR